MKNLTKTVCCCHLLLNSQFNHMQFTTPQHWTYLCILYVELVEKSLLKDAKVHGLFQCPVKCVGYHYCIYLTFPSDKLKATHIILHPERIFYLVVFSLKQTNLHITKNIRANSQIAIICLNQTILNLNRYFLI